MTLQGRDLQEGMSGSDVAELQKELNSISYTVPAAESQASSFGAGTLAAVQKFQTAKGLPATGVVDAATAAALTAAVTAITYVISGRVSSPVSASVSGLTAQLVDKNVGGDLVLTSVPTGSNGLYSISIAIDPSILQKNNKTQPDLQVKILNGTTFLAASLVAYNAPLSLTLNVTLPPNATGLPSEYEALAASITANYGGTLIGLKENSQQQDITFLANKTGWDARAVALAALASQFAQISAPPLTPPAGAANPPAPGQPATGAAPAPPANVSLSPEFYYALFRAGLPADSNSLFRTPSQSVQAIWQQAILQGVIPKALSAQVQTAVTTYQALATANLLTATPTVGISTLGEMLTVSKLTAAQQTTFSQICAQLSSDPTTFWNAVSAQLGAAATKTLQLDGQLFYLTLNNAPLVTALHSAETTLSTPQDLVTLGYYDPAKWKTLIGTTAIPSQIAGQSADNYANFLAAQIRLSFPTAVAGDQVKRGAFPITDTPAVASQVSAFLTANSGQFFIGAEPVEAYVKRTNPAGATTAVVNQIKRLQRVYQLTADDQSMSVLLRHNVDSAYAITRYGAAGFQRAFQNEFGNDNAAAIYSRARHVYSSVMNVTLGYLGSRQSPYLGGNHPVFMGFPSAPSNQPYPIIAYPTLEKLFGSLDYCTCDDCRSILSPAAYLVDLLQYLDQPSLGSMNPQQVLFQRRPDLQYLPLTCDNTNTALPYIDVVNETLEYYVANGLSLANFQGNSTDDTVTSAELIACPQFTNDAAYMVLQNAFFPPPLPFNRPLAQLRQLFQNMGPALPDVMAALRTSNSATINPTGTGYSAGDVCLEYLGISRDEYRVFTDGTLTFQNLYGYPSTETLAQLQSISLQDYSRRTGVSYDDLVSMLETQFINPNAILIERLERLQVSFATLQSLNANPSLAATYIWPAGLDATAYGGSTPTDYAAVAAWVTNAANFTRVSNIITLSNPTNNPDECSGTSFEFQYLNGNPLTATDFVKLIRFIRFWQKLGLTIEQTDDLLSAFYPAADLPSGNNDTVNLPLLNAGFKVALLRIGVLFQVMDRLSLTANNALGALLACWSNIGTVGDNALYQQMFGGPAIQREDPGAPIATIGGAPNAKDTLLTTINGVPVPYLVNSGDTLSMIATNIATAINKTTTPDPTVLPTVVPLNQRISASSQGAVVTIRAGFTLTWGPLASFSVKTALPLLQSAVFVGAVAAGTSVTAQINNTVSISYSMQPNDTAATVAAGLAIAINSCTSPDPYSGLPLNSLLVATSSGAVITVSSINSGAPLSLSCSITPGATGSYTAGTQVPAYQTATVGGTVASGDTLTTTINGLNIPFPVTTQNSAVVASAIVTAINGTTTPDPVTGMPINRILHASASGATVTISANDPAMALTLGYAATGAMTYAASAPVATSQTATVAGSFATGCVLSTTINAVTVTYTVTGADNPTSIAANIATAINVATTVDAVTNVPLNQLVSASAAGGILTITMKQNTGSFNLALSVQSGTYIAGVQTAPFADNGYGDFLSDPSQTIFGHEPVLRAAFNLTGAEFSVIAGALQFTPITPLTLSNISSLFRIGWFAHTLGISVVEFLGLRQMTGLDPFAPLDLNAIPPVEPPALRFIALVQAMKNAGLQPGQALYMLWNDDISGKSTPDVSVVTGFASALRAAFAAVAAQFTIQSDPDGTIAQSLMALVYGNTATNFYFGMLNNTLVTQISYPNSSYPNPQPAPVQTVLDASGGRLSYDNLGKQLSFAGVLDPSTKAAIQAAITANQNVQALIDALGDLGVANQQIVGPFFATYPELLPLYTTYATSTDPVQQRRSTLLANFLPTLIQKRNQEQALATITAAAGSDPSFANVLLEDPTVLHAATDLTAPIVYDLTALNHPGLAAQIFLSNAVSGQPNIVLDADPANYAPSTIGAQQTATVSGKVTVGDVLKTVINGVPISYTVVATNHTAADVAAGIAAAVVATATTDPFSGLPLKNVITASASAGVVTFQASNVGTDLSVNTSVTPAAAPPTYSAGAQVPASQSATVGGAPITVGDILTTTINTIPVNYTVVASDTSVAILAAHIASAINAVATADPASGKPLNQVVSATSAGGVVTVTASVFGPDLTLTCSLSAGATETYTPGASNNASQTATLSALLPANDGVVTTINSVAVQYPVAATDTTLAGLVANVAAAINADTTVDSVTNKPLNAIVTASSAAGTLTITTIAPGVPFALSCSLSLGAFTLNGQVAILQSAMLLGGINAGDVISTTINGATVNYTVAGTETGLSALAANIAAAVNATASVNKVVTATSLGSCIIYQSAGSSAFSLTCSTSSQAAVSYSTGPQFPAWEATVTGGFFTNDVLTTNINDASVTYTVGASGATPAAVAGAIVAAVNASATIDPLTSLPVNGLVSAANSGATVIFRFAGPAFVISGSLSAGATENYAIGGELPTRPGGGPIAGVWSGYIEAPQDGDYNIEIDTDPGATVTLSVDGTLVPMTPSTNKSVWNNAGPISLTAGELTPINLTATSVQSALSLNWQSAGLGWQTIPASDMYSDTLLDRLQTAYVRFLKITALATELSLTADEIAFLGTSNNYAVDTTDADSTNAGSASFTPASMTNIGVNSKLVLDSGPAQEVVTVTATTTNTFTALTVNAHNGSSTPFPIVDYPNASTGQGWLNFLTVAPIPDSTTSYLQQVPSYAAGPQTFAQQTATVANTVTAGNALTTTINGVASVYKFVAGDTLPTVAANMAAAINANINPDPISGLPLNQAFSAFSAGAIVTVTALIFGPDFTMICSASAGATCTYTPGAPVLASQTAIVSGVLQQNSVLVTTFNGVAVQYAVSSTDTTAAGLAAKVAAAINATTVLDPFSNAPINSLVNASNTGGTITITTINPGAPLTIGCSVAAFRDVLWDLLNFARIKAAVSPNDEQLLDVLEDPTLMATDGVTPQIIKLTGWSLNSLNSLLAQFFGNTRLGNLSVIENLRKVFDAYAIVTNCRISAAALLSATTNAPSPATVASLQSALRALYAPSDWLNVIQPINDALRIQQRDALVAYILQQLGDQYVGSLITFTTTADAPAGSTTLTFGGVAGVQVNMGVQGYNIPPNTAVSSIASNTVTLSQALSADVPLGSSIVFVPSGSLNITTADNLFEYFLIDVETQPPVQTSRIRLALSSVQLFIERILRNLEPQTQPTDIDGSLWTWMKRYRVWQANREVFLWPENWLYPELRDDQSPIFQQMMSALLQSDITDDAASAAYLDYLSNLELVAKLEPCGLYYVPASGDSDEASYLVARTAGAHRKYYFRELQYGSWTPWTEIKIDCEDMPITPIVWNGRLMLFWLKITKTTTPQFPKSSSASGTAVTSLTLGDLQSYGQQSVSQQTQSNLTVSAVLCWSEYYNGKWQPQKSSDVNRPTTIGPSDTDGFDVDRNLLQIVPVNVAPQFGMFGDFQWNGSVYVGQFMQGPVNSTPLNNALILGICQPASNSLPSYTGGFVLYNTHSLPVCWEDVSLGITFTLGNNSVPGSAPLPNLAVPNTPGRSFGPIEPYTGGTPSSDAGPFGIVYWSLNSTLGAGPPASPLMQSMLFGLNRVPRTVDAACSEPDLFAPFLFEDRCNSFYVTTAQVLEAIYTIYPYGLGVTRQNYTAPSIPGLATAALPTVGQQNPFGPAVPIGGSDTRTQIGKYLQQNDTIRAAINSVAPVSYQGVSLYPGGQFVNPSVPPPQTATTVTTKTANAEPESKERSK
jgi:Neuraminidase-like domain/Putative peptidoglycan binding domain/Salmonella virulence plasmid 28.1kDa A protein